MTREQKIKFLQLVEDGSISTNDIKPMPGMELKAITADLSGLQVSDVQYPFYLTTGYKCKETGAEYTPEQVFKMIEDYGRFVSGVLPIVEKKEGKLYTSYIYFKEISNDEQAQQILLRHTKDSGGIS